MTPQPPPFPNTPGMGSADPDVTTELALNDHLWLVEFARYHAIVNYLNLVKAWKENSQQRVANGLPLDPAPIPPAGYTPVVEAPSTPPPPPSFSPVVRPKSQFGQYPAPGDNNPAGTVIANPYMPGGKLVKVIRETPFGAAHWWEETA